jgi:hypothetical protein
VKDPKERFQKSSEFVDLSVGELKRELYLKCVKTDSARQASSKGPCLMSTSFIEFCEELANSDDEWIKFVMAFIQLVNLFHEFNDSVAVGDSINIEALYLEALPFFIECKKNGYQE